MKYAKFSDDFLSDFRLDDNGETLVLTDKRGYTRAVKLLNYEEKSQGKWIEKHCDYGVYYRCSNCHKMPPNYECDYKEGAIKTNFCPNCGADMREASQ